jgi:hypothetical protein
VTTYTFTDVVGDHTIEAVYVGLPAFSGVVSGPDGPIYSAKVTLSDGGGSVTTNAAGVYVIVPPANGNYTLTAAKGGYVTSVGLPATMASANVENLDISLAKSTGLDPLVVLDASTLIVGADLATWPNTGSLGGAYAKYTGGTGPDVVEDLAGKPAVQFVQLSQGADGRRTMVLDRTGPDEISGNSDWTISTDLYRAADQPDGENAYAQWAGGAYSDLQSAIFRYTNNGAYIHWGADSGFQTVPSALVNGIMSPSPLMALMRKSMWMAFWTALLPEPSASILVG